jgi:hypothetical protein
MPSLLEQLQELPDSWGLVAVDGDKRPYQQRWQSRPLSKAQAAAEVNADRAAAIGVIAGPASGGLLFVDHDGISATTELERLGVKLSSLPRTVANTSGRSGRFQLFFRVPEQYWPAMVNRRVFPTGVVGDDGKAEQLDLRWDRHQSVVVGRHPITGAYRWLTKRSPADIEVAEAPLPLIELLLKPPPAPLPLLQPAPPIPSSPLTLPLLDFITRDSRALIETGGTPGQWNDDQLRLALDLVGTEAWIIAQGHRSDRTAAEAFDDHIKAAQVKSSDFNAKKALARFTGASDHNPTPGTPEAKLLDRLRYHQRQQQTQKSTRRAPSPSTPAGNNTDQQAPLPVSAKLVKLEAPEIIALLRNQPGIRFNIFTQQIEVNNEPFRYAERFYLDLAQQGIKATKDLAIDCLLRVAHENTYDPVREYLDFVADNVAPGCIDSLSTTYLRTVDNTAAGAPTLYDEMLKRTLIGAVRRAYEPGCKHDTACVLMGDQGAFKSSFWAALGGPFFSDALGDCSSKDDLMILHRSWIMEWAELDHVTSRKHAGTIKSFLTQAIDVFRVPYGRSTETFPRRGIIVGTTNRSEGFLQDETGNRRFWIIPVTATRDNPIDTPALLAERDAIWSAAVHAYRAGAVSFLPADLEAAVQAENLQYQSEHPWRAVIETWLATPKAIRETITSELILTDAVQKPVERQTRADQMQVANLMRDLGFVKRRTNINGTQRWAYFKA